MRSWRSGTSSGTRSAACSSSSAIGSGRLAPGSHAAWVERGVSDRHDLPLAARSAGERYGATGARADRPSGRGVGLRPAVAMRSQYSSGPGKEAQQPLSTRMSTSVRPGRALPDSRAPGRWLTARCAAASRQAHHAQRCGWCGRGRAGSRHHEVRSGARLRLRRGRRPSCRRTGAAVRASASC
jgi:hypothetical protein